MSFLASVVRETTVVPEPPAVAPVITDYDRARTRERVRVPLPNTSTPYYSSTFSALGQPIQNENVPPNYVNVPQATGQFSYLNTVGSTQPGSGVQNVTLDVTVKNTQPTVNVTVETSQPGTELFFPISLPGFPTSLPDLFDTKTAKTVAITIQNSPSSSATAYVNGVAVPPGGAISFEVENQDDHLDPTTITVYPNGATLTAIYQIRRV